MSLVPSGCSPFFKGSQAVSSGGGGGGGGVALVLYFNRPCCFCVGSSFCVFPSVLLGGDGGWRKKKDWMKKKNYVVFLNC